MWAAWECGADDQFKRTPQHLLSCGLVLARLRVKLAERFALQGEAIMSNYQGSCARKPTKRIHQTNLVIAVQVWA